MNENITITPAAVPEITSQSDQPALPAAPVPQPQPAPSTDEMAASIETIVQSLHEICQALDEFNSTEQPKCFLNSSITH